MMTQVKEVVNDMASQVSARIQGVTAVARVVASGDPRTQLEIDACGEVLECRDAVNAMITRLRTIAAEATRVATDVGADGRLGRQISVPDAEGAWQEMIRGVRTLSIRVPKCDAHGVSCR